MVPACTHLHAAIQQIDCVTVHPQSLSNCLGSGAKKHALNVTGHIEETAHNHWNPSMSAAWVGFVRILEVSERSERLILSLDRVAASQFVRFP